MISSGPVYSALLDGGRKSFHGLLVSHSACTVSAGVHQAFPPQQSSRTQYRIAADFREIANDGTKFFESGILVFAIS